MTDTQQKGIGAIAVVLIIALIVLIGGVGFFAVKGTSKQQSPAPTQAIEQTSPTQAMDSMEKKTPSEEDAMEADTGKIVVVGQNFFFSPSKITVKKGQKVTLEFKSNGGFHDFVVDELGVKTEVVQSGKSQTVTFTPNKVGSFEFYCSVGNHRAMGMKGTITVTE